VRKSRGREKQFWISAFTGTVPSARGMMFSWRIATRRSEKSCLFRQFECYGGGALEIAVLERKAGDVSERNILRRSAHLGLALWSSYSVLIGPGYCDTRESMVNNVMPSTVACATKTLSNGSL
jgi:hypothetical protein